MNQQDFKEGVNVGKKVLEDGKVDLDEVHTVLNIVKTKKGLAILAFSIGIVVSVGVFLLNPGAEQKKEPVAVPTVVVPAPAVVPPAVVPAKKVPVVFPPEPTVKT